MTQPLLLVLVSLLVYVIASNGYWWLWTTRSIGLCGHLGNGMPGRHAWLCPTVARSLYLSGFPILALGLRLGGPATSWGFDQPISALGLSQALVGGSLVAGVLILQTRALGLTPPPPIPLRAATLRLPALALLDAVALELHWALYRAGCLSVGLSSPTTAVYLSLCLVALEAWASPTVRLAWRQLASDPRPLWPMAAAILSASLFLRTASVPLCIAGHSWLALLLLLARLTPAPGPHLQPAGPQRGQAGAR